MNATPLPPASLPGFTVVPKHQLADLFSPSQSAFYVLVGRRGDPARPRERIVFVNYLDHFVSACQHEIEDLWEKHRVLITHVAVKLGRGHLAARRGFEGAYARAVAIKQLREELHPLFRRV